MKQTIFSFLFLSAKKFSIPQYKIDLFCFQLKNGTLDWSLGGISITYFRYESVEFMAAIISTSYHATYVLTENSSGFLDDKYAMNITVIISIIVVAILCITGLLKTTQILSENNDASFLRYIVVSIKYFLASISLKYIAGRVF